MFVLFSDGGSSMYFFNTKGMAVVSRYDCDRDWHIYVRKNHNTRGHPDKYQGNCLCQFTTGRGPRIEGVTHRTCHAAVDRDTMLPIESKGPHIC